MTLEIPTQRRTSMAVRRWEILLVRARATRNLKLEPEPDYDHAQISAQMIKVRFFYSELLESLK